MSKSGSRIIAAAEDAHSVVKGGTPAASITFCGHRYVAVEPGPLSPHVIAAAWGAWKSRGGYKLGPGPAFREAIEAALRALASPSGGER